MTSKKRNKKYNPYKDDDFIHPLEHKASHLWISFIKIRNILLNNEFTIRHLVNEGIFIYQISFVYDVLSIDYTASNIRDWLDIEIQKLGDNIQEIRSLFDKKIAIPIMIIELIIQLLDELEELINNITSRYTYAKLFNEALVRFAIQINTIAPWIGRFTNRNTLKEEMQECRKRIQYKEILKNKQSGKIAYFTETGDIDYCIKKTIRG